MVQIILSPYKKSIFLRLKIMTSSRHLSKYLNKDITSKAIRQKYLEYFINENNHKFIKSSPVVPYCDPTVAFVNAGMNQFKGIFLGTQKPKHRRVANSQKCVRVGGKHNDLSTVGADGYHHTFFEMLGNWSFGDYFKLDACKLAWDLLTNVYKLPKNKLYVTYFKGDSSLGFPEDIETKEIWRKIGICEDKILPFGMKDNFWEMGLTGPCGPCTEIHYDHLGTNNRAEFVNKGLHDLTEIWNIVFIQYNRLNNGNITVLPEQHVDTGMGFERLTSILQGKISNYDTDNFNYLLKAIYKNCRSLPEYEGKFGESDWNNLDKSYRILADHSRMISVCLADGIIPEENQKLRRILRKAFHLSETVFRKENGLLRELSNYVVENLGPIYPELEKNITQVHQIIDYEEEIYKSLRISATKDWEVLTKENSKLLEMDVIEMPSFIAAYKQICSSLPTEITSEQAFKLYDTFGIDEEGILKISSALNLKFDPQDLRNALDTAKLKSKENVIHSTNEIYLNLINDQIPKTEDYFKYRYSRSDGKYSFENIESKILKIFKENEAVSQINQDEYCSLVLNKTNLYSEAGGQIGDKGIIIFGPDSFEVTSVENLNGFILHKGFFKSSGRPLLMGSVGNIFVNEEFRLSCMKNHTSTHLLNAAVKNIKGATCQKSSKVNDKYLDLDVAIFGKKLSIEDIDAIERKILSVIKEAKPVNVTEVNSQRLLEYDHLTLIPGEIYPENGIRIIDIEADGFLSREPCCGTHVMNTEDIKDFCVVNVKSLGRSTTSICAITGEKAKIARKYGTELLEEIESLKLNVGDNIDEPEMLEKVVSKIKKKLNSNNYDSVIPLTVKFECNKKLEAISKQIKNSSKENLRDFIEIEMKNALESKVKTTRTNQKYIIHYLRSSLMMEDVPLQKATRLCSDLPILVISFANNTVKARCCVPKKLKTDTFNAELWMNKTVASVFKSRSVPPKGQDGTLVCNMKARKIHIQEWDPLLRESLDEAQKFIEENI